MVVRVLVNTIGNSEEIAFTFPTMCSAGAFMECLALSAEEELEFVVTYEADKQGETKSRFINPEEEK